MASVRACGCQLPWVVRHFLHLGANTVEQWKLVRFAAAQLFEAFGLLRGYDNSGRHTARNHELGNRIAAAFAQHLPLFV